MLTEPSRTPGASLKTTPTACLIPGTACHFFLQNMILRGILSSEQDHRQGV